MVDPFTLTAVLAGVASLVVSILTHIKFSKCYGFELKTINSTTPTGNSPSTPLLH